jgi:hypothetical protein
LLERQQNASANAGRVFDALEPRCEINPIVVTEVGMRRACRDHEIVVRNWTRAGLNGSPCEVDAADLRHQHRRIALLPQDVPDRPSDLGRRQRGGRDLVEQRLEAMMVLTIDYGHVDGHAIERLRCFEPAEACADDDDLWTPL